VVACVLWVPSSTYAMSNILSLLKSLLKTCVVMALGLFVCVVLLGIVYFPHDTDDLSLETSLNLDAADEFYEEVYSPVEPSVEGSGEDGSNDHEYVQTGREAGETRGATETATWFVEEYGLRDARVLEVGAGSGQLQDLVDDYTGLDIAASAARFFHKPFVHGSATDLPFEDSEFDAVWTMWVLEHVLNPELALAEMRRVTRDGGVILLAPAWNCPSWWADGYQVRPYGDLDPKGKLIKASLTLRAHPVYQYAHLLSARLLRRAFWEIDGGGPTTFRYRRVTPNFDRYWVPDSDAVVSLDPYEAMLWHTSRGDECLNCAEGLSDRIMMGLHSLVIRVHKDE